MSCYNLVNCSAVAGTAFQECINMTNCVGTGNYGYVECVNMANCNGFGETNTFYSCKFCSNCAEDPDTGREASWGGEDNKNIDYDTCPGLARPVNNLNIPLYYNSVRVVVKRSEANNDTLGYLQIDVTGTDEMTIPFNSAPAIAAWLKKYNFINKQQYYRASGNLIIGKTPVTVRGVYLDLDSNSLFAMITSPSSADFAPQVCGAVPELTLGQPYRVRIGSLQIAIPS